MPTPNDTHVDMNSFAAQKAAFDYFHRKEPKPPELPPITQVIMHLEKKYEALENLLEDIIATTHLPRNRADFLKYTDAKYAQAVFDECDRWKKRFDAVRGKDKE